MRLLSSARLFKSTVHAWGSLTQQNRYQRWKKMEKERCYPHVLRYFVYLDQELERKAGMEQGVGKNAESVERKAALAGTRFEVVRLCEIKSHFVTIDSRVLYGILKEISSGLDVRNKEFTGENRDTYWTHVFDVKRLNTSQKRYSEVSSKLNE
jgi:hypothetical protein